MVCFVLTPRCSHTDMLQPHFINCRGVSGAGGNMQGSREFWQFYLVLILFYRLQRDSNGFIAEKIYLYLTKDPEVYYFPGRGVSYFFHGGVQMLIFIETHIRTCCFPRGVRTPYPPLDPHMGNVIIMEQYLSQPGF